MKRPFNPLTRVRLVHDKVGDFLRFHSLPRQSRTAFPLFTRSIAKRFTGPGGEVIKIREKQAHSEGDFMLTVSNKRHKPLGKIEIKLRPSQMISVESVQGEKGREEAQTLFFRQRKDSWSGVLAEHLINVAKKSGVRGVFLIKPEKQFYLPNSPNLRNASERILKIKKRFGFQELPPPEELFPHPLRIEGNLSPEQQYYYQEGKGKYWVLLLQKK